MRRVLGHVGLWTALLAALLTIAAPAEADLAPGTWTFNRYHVGNIVSAPGAVFAAGEFSGEQAATGGGLFLDKNTSGSFDGASLPKVVGTVSAVVPDGAGGFLIAGDFSRVGAFSRHGLARVQADGAIDAGWDAALEGGSVDTIAIDGSKVYVGGQFTSIGGQPRTNLARLNISTGAADSWAPSLPAGAQVRSLTKGSTAIFVNGFFTSLSGQARNQLAAFDATSASLTSWNPAMDVDGYVNTIRAVGSTVYVGGGFSTMGGQPRDSVAAVDETTGTATAWTPTVDGTVGAIAERGQTIYLGGGFTHVGGQPHDAIAAVDATTGAPSSWDPQVNGGISTIAIDGGTVYAGGSFTNAGGQARQNVAAIDALSAQVGAFNPQPGDDVGSIAIAGTKIYIGGSFSGAGPLIGTVRHLARVLTDGTLDTDWAPNPNDAPTGMAGLGSTLFMEGAYGPIGGQTRAGFAAVSMTSGLATPWNPVANCTGSENAVLPTASGVYLSGCFTTVNGQPRAHLAKVDAGSGALQSWNPGVTTSSSGGVNSLAERSGVVYAGGTFSAINGVTRANLAAIDGTTGAVLTDFDAGTNGPITDLLATSDSLFAAGAFSTIGGATRNVVAALNPTTGAATAFNANADIGGDDGVAQNQLALDGGVLYVAGGFSAVGGRARNGIAGLNPSTGAPTAFDPTYYGGPVYSLAAGDGKVYLGGYFNRVTADTVTGPFAILDPAAFSSADTTPPVITIGSPAEGQHFGKDASVPSSFSCDDAGGSGVASCAGPSSIDTSTVGPHSFSVAATDKAGNTAAQAVNYVVDPPTGSATASGDTTASGTTGAGTTASGTTAGTTTGGGGSTPPSPSGSTVTFAGSSALPVTKSGVVTASVKCIGMAMCAGAAKLTYRVIAASSRAGGKPKVTTIATARYTIAPGKTGTIRFKLSAEGRKLLKKGHGRLKASLQLKPDGTLKVAVRTISLKTARK